MMAFPRADLHYMVFQKDYEGSRIHWKTHSNVNGSMLLNEFLAREPDLPPLEELRVILCLPRDELLKPSLPHIFPYTPATRMMTLKAVLEVGGAFLVYEGIFHILNFICSLNTIFRKL